MSTYTMSYRYDDDPAEASHIECSGDHAAIQCARSHMQRVIDKSPTLQRAEVAVGAGSMLDDDPRWIGCWRWSADTDDWIWSAEA